MDKALYAVDPLTGLLVAAALVHPDRKLNSIDTEFVLNRFREKSFARGADREIIKTCSRDRLGTGGVYQLGFRGCTRDQQRAGPLAPERPMMVT